VLLKLVEANHPINCVMRDDVTQAELLQDSTVIELSLDTTDVPSIARDTGGALRVGFWVENIMSQLDLSISSVCWRFRFAYSSRC
jgi:hypothetical protein